MRSRSLIAASLAGALIIVGALLWFRPYLDHKSIYTAEVPTPAALFELSEFTVMPGRQACMSSITITPTSQLAEFHLRPAKTGAKGPPVELVLRGPGYRSVVHVPGGYPGGAVALPMTAPHSSVIGSACFIDRGRSSVLLDGTTEPRTVAARTKTTVNARQVVGDIALTFLSDHPKTPLDRLGEIFGHASNLTDRLIPVWLIWIIAILTALGVPTALVAALFLSLRADERVEPARS